MVKEGWKECVGFFVGGDFCDGEVWGDMLATERRRVMQGAMI